jgi:hypothetical protein
MNVGDSSSVGTGRNPDSQGSVTLRSGAQRPSSITPVALPAVCRPKSQKPEFAIASQVVVS